MAGMGLATTTAAAAAAAVGNSMSQGFQQGVFSFSDAFDRPGSSADRDDDDREHHVAQQSRRDKLRLQAGFEPIGEEEVVPGNMLSEMFDFPTALQAPTATDLLASQMHLASTPIGRVVGFGTASGDWYGSHREGISQPDGSIVDAKNLRNADAAAAMQLFLMNPQPEQEQQHRSPSPPRPMPQGFHHQGFAAGPFSAQYGDLQHHQGGSLSLSLSSSRQQLGQGQQFQMGGTYGPSAVGMVNVLRNSKYSRAAQELLEEFCSVGRGEFRGRGKSTARTSSNPNNTNSTAAAAGGGGPSTSAAGTSEVPALTPAERFEHQRKKTKLISMLDEVNRRYNHYCEQMQAVVDSFDSVMGIGAATPYTALAHKAMSRHFRCLKDAIAGQLKQSCELLGEKDAGSGSGITKGETPRLRMLEQSWRHQKAFHQMGMMEQEAWRPQRGLPERSVSTLRAWLFEHFLHPYPSDADKLLLARQTGLSRSQVSNWFINARVRLWKPMVEEMYQQEAKEEGAASDHLQGDDGQAAATAKQTVSQSSSYHQHQHQQHISQGSLQTSTVAEIDVCERQPRVPPEGPAGSTLNPPPMISLPPVVADSVPDLYGAQDDLYRQYMAASSSSGLSPAGQVRLGTSGDVSLTLGLRHAGGNAADQKNRPFGIRDFGGC